MRTIEFSKAFRRDHRRISATPRHRGSIDTLLEQVITMLAADGQLPVSLRDYLLTGEWRGYRECRLKPDPLLIYRKPDSEMLRLARLGSHSELFR